MTYKRKNPKPKRPSDKLPLKELQKKWNKYLNAHVGRPGAIPRYTIYDTQVGTDGKKLHKKIGYEVLMSPQALARLNIPDMPCVESPKMALYKQACRKALERLPLLQRIIIKSYFGIDRMSTETQEQIARKVGISQKNVHRWIKKVERTLNTMIQREVAQLVKKEIQGYKISYK